MTFTVIALAVYLYSVGKQLMQIIHNGQDLSLPDIDGSLMVLMGLSQGGYLGKKLASATPVTLSSLVPSTAKAGDTVQIFGTNFGGPGQDSALILDGAVAPADPKRWSDSKIGLVIPAQPPAGGKWQAGQQVVVQVVASGQLSTNTVTLTIGQ